MKKIISKILLLLILCGAVCVGFAGCGTEGITVELSVYAVNDLHGKFMDTSDQPGVDEFTTYMKNLYADAKREEVLLSSGDMWQGTVESSSNKGQLMTEWMNEVGFASMTLGNHEFDWGPDVLQPNSDLAEFPFLGINVIYNGEPATYCKPSVVVQKTGVKIGIIGAVGDCLSSISGEFQTGLDFLTGRELTDLVKAESRRLREEEGCGFIIYSIHDGGSGFSSSGVNAVTDFDMGYYDTALSDGYVDLVFEAHTHSQYILRDEHGVYHLQGGGENESVSCADIEYNTTTGEYTVTPRLIGTDEYAKSSLKDDPCVERIYDRYFSESDPYTTVLGTNSSKWTSSDICGKVAELYYKKGVETWGEEYDITLAGGYLKMRSPYDLAAGKVTYANIFSLLPFDNAVVLGSIKGSYLKSNFLSTKKNYYCYCPDGNIAASIDNNATYYIIVDTYTAYYRPNHITEVARLSESIYARDLVAEYIRGGYRA